MRMAVLAAVAAGAGGCGGDGPEVPEVPFGAATVEGTWGIPLPEAPSCSPPLEPFRIVLELARTFPPGDPHAGEREYLQGTWSVEGPEGPAGEWLQGWVELRTRRLHLLLWQGVHVSGSVLDARVIGDSALDGWLTEPIPPGPGGFAEPIRGYPGGFSTRDCLWRFQVTARD
ncbi:MAG: hypothetical protein RRA92_09775 [Gemmatimonadota bacterium]|nr:hypothetical protein [Gemmatimonadota bacterium]